MHNTNFDIRPSAKGGDHTAREYLHHSSGQRVFTDAVILESLSKQYPGLRIVVVPRESCDLLAYAAAGHAKCTPLIESATCPFSERIYLQPSRRMDAHQGVLADNVQFGKFVYKYKDADEFIMYMVNGRDGESSYPINDIQYLVLAPEKDADDLIKEAAIYGATLHEEIWVFDQGFWQKNGSLFRSVQKASWDDVILDSDMKREIQNDVMRFFRSRERYNKLRVPWKRGIIYYGPPGNGKTVSICAMMKSLYDLKDPVPTLYVRSLVSFGGPEYSIAQIFMKARQEAPCLLVFEDLDSLVRDDSRTYFLNEVDGLQVNEGVLMIGSTNYLDRLDPGISKRPSRFDRKWEFPKPNFEERVKYSNYWRRKLSDNDEIEFPEKLSVAIAKMTDDFSFAYMQEAFVASLLNIADRTPESATEDGSGDDKDLEDLILYQEMRKQIHILREEM